MKSRQQDFVLGLVIIIMVALFVGTFLFVFPRFGGPTQRITVRFDHEDGVAPLKEGSPVSLGGAMQVGKVTSMAREIVRNEKPGSPPTQLVIIANAVIDADLPLYRDCQITTDQPPVGGGGSLVILSIGTPAKGPLAGDAVSGLPPQSLASAISGLSRRLLAPDGLVDKLSRSLDETAEGSLMNKLSLSLTDINVMTNALKTQLSPGEQKTLLSKIHLVLDNIAGMSAELRSQTAGDNGESLIAKVHLSLDVLARALGEANEMLRENRSGLRNTVASVERMSQTLDQDIIGKLKRDFDRDDPASLLGKLHVAMNQLNTTLNNVVEMSDTVKGFVILSRPALERTVDNLKSVSSEMRSGVQELLVQPWRFIQPPGSELKRLDVFEAARSFAEAATGLDDAAARLEAIVKAAPADGRLRQSDEDVREIQASLRKAFERYRKAEDYLYEKLK